MGRILSWGSSSSHYTQKTNAIDLASIDLKSKSLFQMFFKFHLLSNTGESKVGSYRGGPVNLTPRKRQSPSILLQSTLNQNRSFKCSSNFIFFLILVTNGSDLI